MGHRTFRALVFLLAGWPLLVPPGLCICQFIRGTEIAPRLSDRSCAGGHDDCCPDADCDGATTHGVPCGNDRTPTDEQHPPGCPANKKVDHSRLLERPQPLASASLLTRPLSYFLDLSSGQRLDAVRFPAHASHQPIYLAFCTLLI